MRISPLTETNEAALEYIAGHIQGAGVQVHITTTELSYALGVSQDTIKRRLNRERQKAATANNVVWDEAKLPQPYGRRWCSRAPEWDLVVVLRWLAQRPMKRQV